MQDILKLFLARVSYVTLLILLIPGFLFTPRQSSLLTLLTVGIPAVATWAKPGPAHSKQTLLRLVHFVLPAALTASLATLFVFWMAVAPVVSAGLPAATLIATARSAITVFATVCGVLLLIFVEPPTRFLAGGDACSGDWRPTMLAGVLLGGVALLLVIPPVRAFFELGAVSLLDGAVIAAVALLWALLLRFIWRFSLLERLLGLPSAEWPSWHEEH
jgi:cation-transporting ATPase E